MSGDVSFWTESDQQIDASESSRELLPNITVFETITPNRLTMPELNTICADIMTVKRSTNQSPKWIDASSGWATERATIQPTSENRMPTAFGRQIRSCPNSTLKAAVTEGNSP